MTKIVTSEEVKDFPASEIIAGLNHYNLYVVEPYLEVISSRQKEFEPILLKFVEESYQLYQEKSFFPNFNRLLYSVVLLAQFKTQGAFDAVYNVFDIDDKNSYRYWGDYLVSSGAMLYRLINNDFKKVESLLLSKDDIPFNIGGNLYQVLVLAYINKEISREHILNFSQKLLALGKKNFEFIAFLMLDVIDMNLYELKEQMIQVYESLSLIDFNIFDVEEFERLDGSRNYQKEDLEVCKYSNFQYLDDCFVFLKKVDRCQGEYKEYKKILANKEQRLKELNNAKVRAKKAKEKAKKVKDSKKKNRKK